jgi:hypothetical protein
MIIKNNSEHYILVFHFLLYLHFSISISCVAMLKIYYLSWKMQHPEIAYFDETLYNNWAITKIKR